ncbi:MAG: HtaA domain-containing protein, partial [Rhodoglobus sp.]|nr:HtaA domain-containing protein [Rhodoglobus sp.]
VAGAIYGEGTVSLVDAPTVLTEQGSVAFGTYEAGESFDPLTLDLTADPACTTAPAAGPHITAVVAVAVAVLVAISLLVVVMVRRRAQTPGA